MTQKIIPQQPFPQQKTSNKMVREMDGGCLQSNESALSNG